MQFVRELLIATKSRRDTSGPVIFSHLVQLERGGGREVALGASALYEACLLS